MEARFGSVAPKFSLYFEPMVVGIALLVAVTAPLLGVAFLLDRWTLLDVPSLMFAVAAMLGGVAALLAGFTLLGVAFLLFGVAFLLGGVAALLDGWTLVGIPFLLLGVATVLGGVAASLAEWTMVGVPFLLLGIAALLGGVAFLYRPELRGPASVSVIDEMKWRTPLIISGTEPVDPDRSRPFEVRMFRVMEISSLSGSQAKSCVQLLGPGASVNSGSGMILAGHASTPASQSTMSRRVRAAIVS